MANKMFLNVASIRRYSVKDEKTGVLNEGATVFVIQETEDLSGNTLGCDVVTFSAPLSIFQKAKELKLSFPGDCVCTASLKRGAGGKAAMQILDIEAA